MALTANWGHYVTLANAFNAQHPGVRVRVIDPASLRGPAPEDEAQQAVRVADAIRWYVELGHNHGIMPVLPGGPDASSDEDADQRRALVADGRAAMWMTLVGLGNPATQMTAGGKEAGMAPVPGAQRTLFLPHGFFIAADSPHAAACWDWCVYAATHPAHPDLGVPAYKPALLSETFVAQVTPDVVATYRALLDYDNLSQPPGAGPQYQALLDALADIYEGADVQAALEEAQRAASQP